MSDALPDVLSEQVLQRICAECLEMPGLRLSRKQAQRLWGLEEEACGQILEFLLKTAFLKLAARDTYGRVTDGPAAFPRPRTAKAHPNRSAGPALKQVV